MRAHIYPLVYDDSFNQLDVPWTLNLDPVAFSFVLIAFVVTRTFLKLLSSLENANSKFKDVYVRNLKFFIFLLYRIGAF